MSQDELNTHKKILESIDNTKSFFTVFEKVLSSLPIKYNKLFHKYTSSINFGDTPYPDNSVEQRSIFGIITGTDIIFNLSAQVNPKVYIHGSHVHFRYSSNILIENTHGKQIVFDKYDLSQRFTPANTEASVESFAKHGYLESLHEAGDNLYRTLKLLIPENEVAQ